MSYARLGALEKVLFLMQYWSQGNIPSFIFCYNIVEYKNGYALEYFLQFKSIDQSITFTER